MKHVSRIHERQLASRLELLVGHHGVVPVESQAGSPRPRVPSEALILTGRDERLTVQGEDGTFRSVRVTTGRQAGEDHPQGLARATSGCPRPDRSCSAAPTW